MVAIGIGRHEVQCEQARAFQEVHYIHAERVEVSVNPHCVRGWYGRLHADEDSFLELFEEHGVAERTVRQVMTQRYHAHVCTAGCRRYRPGE